MNGANGWLFITQAGNATLMMPTALCIALGLWVGRARGVAWNWAVGFGLAVLVVFGTKVAFLGWGLGIRDLDFTGISGHSTLAAAVLPTFAWWLAQDHGPMARRIAVAAGIVLAALVAVSRLMLDTHSGSEVLIGVTLGGLVACLVIARPTPTLAYPWLAKVVAVVVLFAFAMPTVHGIVPAHGMVVRIAQQLSGRDVVFERGAWENGWQARQ